MRDWQNYAVTASSSLRGLFALEGPDFANIGGNKKNPTLREGLIARGSVGSVIKWEGLRVSFKRNPFRHPENLTYIFERLTCAIDYACLAEREYRVLFESLCAGKTISYISLQILEGVQIVRQNFFTRVILKTLGPK